MAMHEDTTAPRWLQDLGLAARTWRDLVQGQWQLLGAELRLARSAAKIMLVAVLLSLVFAAALVLTLLALLGVALSQWLGWWVWSLLVLIGLLALGLGMIRMLIRRCLHWMSMPSVRASWHAFGRGSASSDNDTMH